MSDELKRPSAKEIDALIATYAALKERAEETATIAKAAAANAEELKLQLVVVVEAFGAQHAGKSKRLAGVHHTATTTTGTTTAVDAAAVDKLKAYLDAQGEGCLAKYFFSERVTYQLVDAPAEALRKLHLGAKLRRKVGSLIAACFVVGTKKPSLKVDVVTPA